MRPRPLLARRKHGAQCSSGKARARACTAGLDLSAKAATPEAVLAAPGSKRRHIVMLRDIDANELGQAPAARDPFTN